MSEVSILIPAYNAGPYIGRALENVRRQIYKDWEAIIVEDGSDDSTSSIVEKFSQSVGQKVSYENNGENKGVSLTRNRLLELATGRVIAFLDADDWWSPQHLSNGMRILDNGADLCISSFYFYLEETKTVSDENNPFAGVMEDLIVTLFQENFIQSSSLVMMHSKIQDSIGGFDPELKVGEDLDYWLRALAKGFRLKGTGEATCYYCKHQDSAMSNTLMVTEQKILFYRKYLDNTVFPAKIRKKAYANSLFQHARIVSRRSPDTALQELKEAWIYWPFNLKYLIFGLRAILLKFIKASRSHAES